MNTRTPAQNRTRADISREARLRNTAKRQGLTLTKSRRRDPRAIDYGLYYLVKVGAPGGHWRSSEQVAELRNLDEVETFLLGDAESK